tara:strand:+ start:761 stop:886 length:126 start_codon:yes stop_codon:yes gene_type:complete
MDIVMAHTQIIKMMPPLGCGPFAYGQRRIKKGIQNFLTFVT